MSNLHDSQKSHNWATRLRILSALLVVCALVILAFAGRLRETMAGWTGEEALGEQIKGTLALAYLRLTKPAPETAPMFPIEHTGLPPYGVNTFLEQEAEVAKVERSLALIADAGFTWIRQQFPWEDIEISAKGDFWDHKWNVSAWAKYDRIVDLAEQYDIEIIARLDNPPAWSRSVGDAAGWTMAPPDDPNDFGDFVWTVVDRYKGRIRYYQIWNEPNIYPEWGDQPANPEAYTELLEIAYRRVKEADPNCVILAAGLAQNTEEVPDEFGPRNMSDLLYLERMYQAGVRGAFDIMGAQVYGLWTGPMDRRTSRDRTNFSRVQLLRAIMVENGDAQKPIWATEVGWSAIPAGFGEAPYGRVSEAQQARYAVEAYQRAQQEWPWMGVMNYWFLRRPSDAERDQAWYYFRMLEPDFEPLPVYDALAEYASAPPIMEMGYHQEDHWAVTYEGSWQQIEDPEAVLGSYHTGSPSAGLYARVRGTEIALVLREAYPEDAQLVVQIDDKVIASPRAGIDPQSKAPTLVLARRLPDAVHDVRVTVGDAPLKLDGFLVQRTPSGQRLALAATGIVAIVGVLILVLGRH
ncbi:MAG: cellulase family glycosylhydrolase [Anaerolineae bacterium]